MTEKYSLEDFLQNKPAPGDLCEICGVPAEQGHVPGCPMLTQIPKALAVHGGAIGEHDREWLKRLQNEPGYLILMRLLNNIVQRYENSARLLSKADPLSNRDAVASAWAYAAISAEIIRLLESEVAAEIAKIK